MPLSFDDRESLRRDLRFPYCVAVVAQNGRDKTQNTRIVVAHEDPRLARLDHGSAGIESGAFESFDLGARQPQIHLRAFTGSAGYPDRSPRLRGKAVNDR